MRRILCAGLILGCLALTVAGCYRTVEGRSKAGVPFSQDKIPAKYPRSLEECRTAALRVLRVNGKLIRDDRVENLLAAKVEKTNVGPRTVYVKLNKEEANLTRVTVQARTDSGAPAIRLAAEIDKQIALQLTR